VLLRAVEDVARANRVVVLAASLDERPERELEITATFVNRRADGLIIAPASEDQSHLAREVAAGLKVVFVDRRPRGLDADVVVSTNESGAAEAVRHLVSHGHQRIAYLGDAPTILTARERLTGYREAMTAAGLEVDERLILEGVGDATLADGAISRLLDGPDPPTALFTAQNFVTVGAIRALRRVERHHEVAVVGFDDFPLADLLDPAVTVVAQDVAALGRIAAERLFARIGGDASRPQLHLVPTSLIRRGSGEIPPP
jgi:LacI family transcriptional regulator